MLTFKPSIVKKKCLKLNLWAIRFPALFGFQLSLVHNDKQSSPKQQLLLSRWDYTHPSHSHTTFRTSRTSVVWLPFITPISTHLQLPAKTQPSGGVVEDSMA